MSAYSDMILGTSGLVSYWRLGEPSGATATDVKAGNNGAYNGTPGYSAASMITGDANTAVQFSGDDHISFASSTPFVTTAFSFEAWIVIDAWSASLTIANIWNGSFGAGWCVKQPDSSPDGRLNLFVSYTVSGPQDLFSTGWSLATPYHVVATCDGTYQRLYRNGVAVASAGPFSAAVADSGSMVFGLGYMTPTGSFKWQGKIDEAAFYNVALSPATVLQHYNGGLGNFGSDRSRYSAFQLRPLTG